jgi:hypothetical protein
MNAPTRLTALGKINDNLNVSHENARKRRNEGQDGSYQDGEAAAYFQSYKIMKAELQRLRNLLQNGSLTQADFGNDLPY